MKTKDGWFCDLAIVRDQLAQAYKRYGKDIYIAYVLQDGPPGRKPTEFVGNEHIISAWTFFQPCREMVRSIRSKRTQNRGYADDLGGIAVKCATASNLAYTDLRKFDLSYNSISVEVVSTPALIGMDASGKVLRVSRARKIMVDQLKGGCDSDKFIIDIRERERKDEFVTAKAIWLERKRDKTARRFTLAERRGHIAWVHDDVANTCAVSPGTREMAARNSRNRLLRAIDAKLKGEKRP